MWGNRSRRTARRWTYGIALSLAVAAGPAWAAGEGASDAAVPEAVEPMRLVVSLSEQRIDVYRGAALIESAPISTGRPGYATPPGVYSILEKRKWHRSTIYSDAPMPFMQRLTWSGIALHEGQLPGYPASHGCIRLPGDFAEELFGETSIGLDVIITEGVAAFEPIEHPALFQPAEPRIVTASADVGFTVSAEGGQVTASRQSSRRVTSDATLAPDAFASFDFERARLGFLDRHARSPLRILVTRRSGRERTMEAQRMLSELGFDSGEIDGFVGPMTRDAVEAFLASRGMEPSRNLNDAVVAELYEALGREPMSGHLYVRQDYVALFDAPVAIADEEIPLGTHFFAAGEFAPDAATTGWLALTLEAEDGTTAESTLDRVTIPTELHARLSQLLTPGSTMVISDAGFGWETGEGTDFIVQP